MVSCQVCPMNVSPFVDPCKPGHEIWEEFSKSFIPAVREVVEFAKRIPGFQELSQHDQVNLLKAGTFEVMTQTSVTFQREKKISSQILTFLFSFIFRCWWCALCLCLMWKSGPWPSSAVGSTALICCVLWAPASFSPACSSSARNSRPCSSTRKKWVSSRPWFWCLQVSPSHRLQQITL